MKARWLALLAVVAVGLVGLALYETLGGPDPASTQEEEGPGRAAESRDGAPTVMADHKGSRRADTIARARDERVEGEDEAPPEAVIDSGGSLEDISLAEARAGFEAVMKTLADVSKRGRRIRQSQWEQHYREANDAFAALSERLDASDRQQRAELDAAHALLQRRLAKVRVRGKKHRAP